MVTAITTNITISKEKHGGRVRGAVNGRVFNFPVGTPVDVQEWELEALNESYVEYTVNGGKTEKAETTVGNTATRLEPPAVEGGKDGNPKVPLIGGAPSGPNPPNPKPTPADKPNGGAADQRDGNAAFDAEVALEGNVADVKGRLAGLTEQQRAKVKETEQARGPDRARKGVIEAIDELNAEKSVKG